MQIKFNFTDFDKKLTRKLAAEWNINYAYRIQNIESEIQDIIAKYLRLTDTYSSLKNGTLAGEFGLEKTSREQKLENVVKKISELVKINRRVITRRDWRFLLIKKTIIDAAITINIIPSDMSWIYEIDDGMFETEKGELIPWLEWLLVSGTTPQVFSFVFSRGFSQYSRSGKGIMVRSRIGNWAVPDKYSGVESDNWITRTLDEFQTEIVDDIGFALIKGVSE